MRRHWFSCFGLSFSKGCLLISSINHSYLRYLIKSTEKIIESLDQITGRQRAGQWSKVDNIRKEDCDVGVPLDVQLVESSGGCGGLAPGPLAGIGHLQHNAPFDLPRRGETTNGIISSPAVV